MLNTLEMQRIIDGVYCNQGLYTVGILFMFPENLRLTVDI